MSDQDETKQTRRAKRRAERAEAEAAEREAAELAADAEESDEQAEEPSDEQAEEASEEEEAEAPVAAAPNRAERRAAKKKQQVAEAETAAEIRDRNRRIREKAANRRREKRERETAVARGLDASEMVDDAFARATHGATQWIRKHFNVIQWVIVLGIAGGIGWQIWSWRHGKTVAKASDELMQAVLAEQGRVGAAATPDPLTGIVDARPTFDTDEARLAAAQKEYEQAIEQRKGSGTAILAKLGLAGVLYDQGKYDDAIKAYEEVKGSELAKYDADVRLRAIEGVGMAREAKGDLEGALKAFKELENADVTGFKALSLLHQARVHFSKGDKAKAKELAKGAQEQSTKERASYQTAGYLDSASRELLAAIDPSTVTPSSAPPSSPYTPEQMDALRDQIMKDPTKLEKMLKEMGQSIPKIPEMPPVDLPTPPEPPPPGSGAP